jgi:Mrp family chromosome partitioning ATPase
VAVEYANAYLQAYRTYREVATASSYDSAIAGLDESIDAIDGELAELNAEIEMLSGLPRATELEQQLEAEINDFLSIAPNAESAAQLETLLDQLQTLQIIRSLQSQDPSLGILIDRRRELNDRIAELVQRRDELAVNAALTSNGIVATSEATEADKTVGSSTVVAVGVLLGGIGGMVLTFGLSVRNRRFLHKGEPELLLDMYLLAEVPRLGSFGQGDLLPVLHQPASRAAESFRFAAGAIDAKIGRPEFSTRHSIAITSAREGDGKTVFTANAGLAAAASGRRVLLVDTDFENASLSRLLIGDASNHKGITNIVQENLGIRNAVVQVEVGKGHRLDVLTPGTLSISPIDFFNSIATIEFFLSLNDMYDLVLFDTPALLEVSYASNLATFADGVVAVIPHKGRVVIQQELSDRLELIGVDTVGYIYNRRPSRAGIFNRREPTRDTPPREPTSSDAPIELGAQTARAK